MITKIISVADIHIRNLRRQDEYSEILSKFINRCTEIVNENGSENTRIVIAGDLLHNKLDISGEGYFFASWFLKKLDNLCKTVIIAGNHDMNMANLNRLDPLSSIFSMCDFKQTYYLDKELDYESGCIEDDNIIWCVYSSFDSFKRPNITEYKIENPDKTFVGLFHGEVNGSKNDCGYVFNNGTNVSHFEELDFCIMGHIHKHQCVQAIGTQLVYCGSLIQQDHGESLSGHGYVLWNVENETYELNEIVNDNYGFYTFNINSIDDIKNDTEELINV